MYWHWNLITILFGTGTVRRLGYWVSFCNGIQLDSITKIMDSVGFDDENLHHFAISSPATHPVENAACKL
jgi:hypothetical protein